MPAAMPAVHLEWRTPLRPHKRVRPLQPQHRGDDLTQHVDDLRMIDQRDERLTRFQQISRTVPRPVRRIPVRRLVHRFRPLLDLRHRLIAGRAAQDVLDHQVPLKIEQKFLTFSDHQVISQSAGASRRREIRLSS
ncbi:MAG: hypothetical protein CMJ49_12180 [Planctomycetaceae bacterium]|nr:hypothetical protein [Planctomycetaceae bacterium]